MIHPATIFFSPGHPFLSVMKYEFVCLEKYRVEIKLLALDMFIDCPETKKLHTGYSTLVLDTIMGAAVMGTLGELKPIATINLSTRHYDQPTAGEWVTCRAEIIDTVDEIAQVTGELFRVDGDKHLASATGSFMIGTRATPLTSSKTSDGGVVTS